jgi:hypothetical protein
MSVVSHAVIVLSYNSSVTACKILDDLIDIRLFREENQNWIEKAIMTRIWISTTSKLTENVLEQLQELLDTVSHDSKAPISAPATHAAQTVSTLHRFHIIDYSNHKPSCCGSGSSQHPDKNSSAWPKHGVSFVCTLFSRKLEHRIKQRFPGRCPMIRERETI